VVEALAERMATPGTAEELVGVTGLVLVTSSL
jgi:hypothetical protein